MPKKKQEEPVLETENQEVEPENQELPGDEESSTPEGDATESSSESPLEEQLAELNDRYLRLFAEFENYKRRNQRERLQLMETAGKQTMLALLPVLDDFDRARQAASQDEEKLAAFESGVGLIIKKLYASLAAQGLSPMETTGKEFNADQHEAVTEIPHPEMSGKVVDTLEKGYTLKGNIIRYAKVVVGK